MEGGVAGEPPAIAAALELGGRVGRGAGEQNPRRLCEHAWILGFALAFDIRPRRLERVAPELDRLQKHVAFERASVRAVANERDQLVGLLGSSGTQRARRVADAVAQP